MLGIFPWGHSFFELNQRFLDQYVKAKDSEEIVQMQKSLFENKGKLYGVYF
jgi:ribosome biogenesis protein Tsr3